MMSGFSPIPRIALLESLRNNNPFASSAAAEPWSNNFPDVASINRQAFADILTLIQRKAKSPREPLAGMVLGEPGAGKTHLLRRILLACTKLEPPSMFVFVKPLVNADRPFHHLLQEIVLCLSKNHEGKGGFSQFDRLVAEIMRDFVRFRVTQKSQDATPNNRIFLEHFEADVFHIYTNSEKVLANSMNIIEKEAVGYIHSQVPETSKRFLDVIFQYKSPEKRGLVRDWIKGSVFDEDACVMLGVPSRADNSDEAKEQEARDMIITLGALFARYHLPLVLCFDQLDNLVKPELIAGFASMIHVVVNDAANMLPLAFILADFWNERFKNKMSHDRAFIDRMESNKLGLSGCNKEEAGELITRRIEQVFGEGTHESIALEKWLLPQLETKMDRPRSPREVILFANQRVRDGEPISGFHTIDANLAKEYQAAYEAVALDFDAWDPESEYLKTAAELFLCNQENVLSCEPGENKYMTWTGTLKAHGTELIGKEIPYACFINTARHWQRVAATLDRCKLFLQKHPDGICTYITDGRCDFSPNWTATNEKRREIESLGGSIVILDRHDAVRWYGLVSLSWKIGSGDILLECDRGLRPATDKDLAGFLKKEFSAHENEGAFGLLTKKK